jgi:Rrf2 family protein
MRVSQRLDYAVRALVLLAMQPEGAYVAAGDLAERLNLPRRFVEQQVTELARAGVVMCRRGASGGCALARPADTISVGDVVLALEGPVLDVPHQTGSAVTEVWQCAAETLEGLLLETDLASVATRQRMLDAAAAPMYYI